MAVNFLLKRAADASKRPDPSSMTAGELDLNYDASTGGLYYKDTNGKAVKVGPVEVGATAPNSTPAGSTGNSLGELWFDTSSYDLKVWNGTAWVYASTSLTFLAPPTAPTDPGLLGQVAIDANYLYVHNGSAWTRLAIDNTW